jgi:hypothetical protein
MNRKPRHGLELVRDLAAELDRIQGLLDSAIQESLALDTPWRAVAEAAGVSHVTLRRKFQNPGEVRHRWPTAPGASA